MDPDEQLRHFWKVQRDTIERNHTPEDVLKTLEDRRKDREHYILAQRELAELVVCWKPQDSFDWQQANVNPLLELEVSALNTFNLSHLVDGLNHMGSIKIDYEPYKDARWQSIKCSGMATANDIETLTRELIPNLHEISLKPSFAQDCEGCLQLIFLVCLRDKLGWSGQKG